MPFEARSFHEPARYEIDPQFIKKIEKFDGKSLGDVDKEFLVLVIAGSKPATEIALHQGLSESEEDFMRRVESVRQLFRESGLAYEEDEKKAQAKSESGEEQGWTVCEFFLSRDPEKAKLAQSFAGKHDPESERQFGLLMGYPETAVDAYVQHSQEMNSSEPELPEEVEFAEYMDFKNFIVSQDHWEEELETVKKWADTIKEVAPDFYRKITSVRRQVEAFRAEHPDEFKKELLESEKGLRRVKFRDPVLYEELFKERERLQGGRT